MRLLTQLSRAGPHGGIGIGQTLIRAISSSALRAGSQPPTVKNWIDGKAQESKATKWIDLTNPATNEVIGRVPESTRPEMEEAVESCKKAFAHWRGTSIVSRQQCMFRLQELIRRNMKKLAENITMEQGKTLPDAEGDVSRGLQVVEHACSSGSLLLGEHLPNVAKDMVCYLV